jgi:hypothetical protein
MWVSEGGRTFVRHYLMDYNAILGAGALPIPDLAWHVDRQIEQARA